MLPVTHTETPQEAAQRQANFIILRSLETKLPSTLFEQVVTTVSGSLDLPKRIDWKGESKNLTFEEVKLNFSHVNQNYLPQLLQTVCEGTNNQNTKNFASQNQKLQSLPKLKLEIGHYQNLLMSSRQLHLQNSAADQKKNLYYHKISRFERMKTIFGHALIEEGYNAPIYNVMFDQTGSFIISGADDGIIKIWDKETLNLQASLHSHNEVITDIDISKCNNYLATASKDGKLIIWDWKNCQKVDEITAHNSTINNIKFFQVKIKNQNQQLKESDKIQILVSCSEDGTIKIFDEFNHVNSSANDQSLKRSKRHEQNINKRERYCLCVTPDDYRPGPGSRNKKIESINVNINGIIAAGTNTGEVFLWKLDINKLKQQQQKAYTWLGSSRKHTKTVHFCEFSPNGKYLFTGSVDGTAKIWNLELEKVKKGQDLNLGLTDNRLIVTLEEKRYIKDIDNQIYFRDRNGQQVNYGDHKQLKNNWQCDTITWSCHGRYAICALSGKVDNQDKEQSKELSVLKVWDSFTGTVIQDLGKENNIQLLNFSFVIAPHPKIEEIFMSGSDGGTICLWNIKTRSLVKKFLEYGVYSYEKYTMNDPYDGKFSPDGSCFVVGSVMGTISLFSNEAAKFKYEGTRVEQFYTKDDEKHLLNLYYDQDEEPQLCGYSLIPYEVQPPSSLIGKFKNARKMTNEEYERNLIVRQELCKEEENFIEGQLEEGLRNNFFNNNNLNPFDMMNHDLDNMAYQYIEQEQEAAYRRDQRARINSQLSQITNNNNNHNQGSYEDQEVLNTLNEVNRTNRRRGRGRRTIIANRVQQQQLRIINTNLDPDNSFYDRESDENFEIEGNDQSEEESDIEDYGEEKSEEIKLSKRYNRENYHQQMQNRRQIQTRNGLIENSRAQRALRRQIREEQEKNNNDDEDDEIQYRCKRQRRKAILQSQDSSQVDISEDDDYKLSDAGEEFPRRRLQRNNRTDTFDCVESEDDDSENQEFEYGGIKTRRAKQDKKQLKKENRRNQSNKRNLRNREQRKRYEGMDSSDDEYMDYEEEKEIKTTKIPSQEEKPGSQGKKNRRIVKEEESENDMVDQDVIIGTDNAKKQKGDEDFELVNQNNQNKIQLDVDMMQNDAKRCEFCKRIDPPVLGPFKRVQKLKGQQDEEYYFHKDCIEVNDISFFNKQKQKWMNLGKALEYFKKKPSICSRCFAIGATIKCSSCDKRYHGFLCSQLYMVFTGQSYQCFQCRNKENYKMFQDKDKLLDKQELKQIKRNMTRDHLLISKQSSNTYIPQINDLVYYFFQGHEKFISYYNCFFYAGDTEELSINYPWKLYYELEKPTLCRVVNVHFSFPSKNVLYLLKRYGRISSIIQTPQIITHLELQIMNNTENHFTIDLFPNELPDFLVLKNLYESSLFLYRKFIEEDKLVGETFKARAKNFNQVKVIGIQERESLIQDETNWENIIYKHIENYRLRERGRRGQRRDPDEQEPPEIMNFWELVLCKELENNDDLIGLVSAFDDSEIQRIVGLINDYFERKKEQTAPFIERVLEKIAPDYRQHVVAEMYIGLVLERLLNKFYRTQEQLFSDLDLISYNAKIYNGEDHQLYKDAKKMVEALRCEIKKNINFSDDIKKQKYEEQKAFVMNHKPVGKLTAPIIRSDLYVSSMDQFKQQLQNKKETLEEIKINSRSLRRNKENDSMHNPDVEVKIEISESSDNKITPNQKTIAEQNCKRLTKNHNASGKSNENDGFEYATGEKIVSRFQKNEQEQECTNQIGKRTRSGRQTRQMKSTLNEDESDREFEKLLNGNDDERFIGQQQNKRIRQH